MSWPANSNTYLVEGLIETLQAIAMESPGCPVMFHSNETGKLHNVNMVTYGRYNDGVLRDGPNGDGFIELMGDQE